MPELHISQRQLYTDSKARSFVVKEQIHYHKYQKLKMTVREVEVFMAFSHYNRCGKDNNEFYANGCIVIYWFQKEEQGGLSADNYCPVLQIHWCLSGHWSYSRGLLNVYIRES